MNISTIIFLLLLISATVWFTLNIKKVIRNIRLGKDLDRTDNKPERWKLMTLVALGQKKMFSRPIPALLHLFVYIGFVLINIEILEMFIDGAFGTHRYLSFLGGFYSFLIGFFELLALFVTIGCAVFLIRRNVIKVKRFLNHELNGWPRSDANIILISEILLMSALFLMNAADQTLQNFGTEHYTKAGNFPISQFIAPALSNLSEGSLILIERFCWWFHMIGILAFLNYLPYSKHFHIVLAFPNVFYSNLNAKGQFSNLESVTNEVKAALDPSFTPPVTNDQPKFGAKDVFDLSWKQLLDSYSCTECGRCTSACPANITGKALSPRKIMMDTRDRLVEVGKNIDANKKTLTVPEAEDSTAGKFFFKDDGKNLLSYISQEELFACTSCNACVQECPINIDPLSIIIDLRRSLIMEQSVMPQEWATMFTNIENNGAPWQFSQADRLNWKNE